MSFEPALAFKAGGFLTTVSNPDPQGSRGSDKDYRKTELWLPLPKEPRLSSPPGMFFRRPLLHNTYLTYARWTAAIATWVPALLFSFVGIN